MNEREETIEEIERVLKLTHENSITVTIPRSTAERAVSLLKEQEPVKPVADGEDSYICNNCGTVIGWDAWEPGGVEEVKDKFCPECGRSVKWE